MAHPLRRFTKKLVIFFNLIIAASFLLGCYGHFLNQETFWFTGLFTLGTLFFLLALIGFIVFWLFVRSKWTLVSIAAIILGWQPLHQLIQFRINHGFALKKKPENFRVMSWNVEHFKIAEHKTHPESKQEMFKLINIYQPDVACFQEMVASDSVPTAINYLPDFATRLKMPFYYYCYNSKLNYDGNHHFGIIIFSRYKLINEKSVSYLPYDYNSIFEYADLVKGADTFRIFNLHLQSLKFSNEDLQYLDKPTIDDESNFKQSRDILSKLKSGFLRRRRQSELVKAEVNKSPYPVVVCGDFNDVPNSYAYCTIGKDLKNAFAEKGSGIGRTYSNFSPTLKIDNIFVDPRFEIMQYARDRKKISDHFPIIADLNYQKP